MLKESGDWIFVLANVQNQKEYAILDLLQAQLLVYSI